MPTLDEVACRFHCPLVVVRYDVRKPQTREMAVDHDGGRAAILKHLEMSCGLSNRCDDEPIHLSVAQERQRLRLQVRVLLAVTEDDRVAPGPCGHFDVPGDLRKVGVRYVRDNQTDAQRPVQTQASCKRVRREMELLCRLADGLLRLLADPILLCLAVERAGHGSHRDAQLPGDCLQCRPGTLFHLLDPRAINIT